MRYLFDITYGIAAILIAPVVAWRSFRTGKYRRGWGMKLFGNCPEREGEGDCVWLHAVSVGEVNLLPRVVSELFDARPELNIVISTTTDTGFDLANRLFPDREVIYCPLDFSWAVSRVLHRIRPTMLILSELELWPNLIRLTRDSGAEVVVINARLSENSYRGYRRVSALLRGTFRRLSLVLAQDETYAQRFRDLGCSHGSVEVTGSIKFDGARTDRYAPDIDQLRVLAGKPMRTESQIASGDQSGDRQRETVWLVGSTQDPEEAYALRIYDRIRKEHPGLRLIVVPRHPERFEAVAQQISASGMGLCRRSSLGHEDPTSGSQQESAGTWPRETVLLVDTIGELGRWWALADIAFVGGSFGNRGGQNMLEPAAYGAAVSFGPNTKNFRDIVSQLIADDAATVVEDEAALEAFVRKCLDDPGFVSAMGERSQKLVVRGRGAINRTISSIVKLLPTVEALPTQDCASNDGRRSVA